MEVIRIITGATKLCSIGKFYEVTGWDTLQTRHNKQKLQIFGLSAQFIKIISHYKKIGYNINVLQQTACLVVNPITVGNFAFLFNCTPVGRTSDSMMVPT